MIKVRSAVRPVPIHHSSRHSTNTTKALFMTLFPVGLLLMHYRCDPPQLKVLLLWLKCFVYVKAYS